MSDSGSLVGDVSKPSARAIYEQRKKYSNIIMADVSQYAVNHLVTFSIGEEDDLASVEDATRKLSVMDAQGKIWVQEMLLQVNGSSIKLFDIDSKDELENYGLAAVARCEAVRPESRSQSLLLLVCQDPTQLKPDVHFFECNLVGAELIRQDINSALQDFKSGGNTQRKEALRDTQKWIGNQTQNAQVTAAQPPKQVSSRTKVIAPEQKDNDLLAGETDPAFIRAERDVELLNRVFDDVEAFVGKLQKSAEAFRVLDQRKRSARGRRREPGEGLLTIRARPPSQEEFEDALAKIKYSFSILARLQSNITNPTSEELIHFLFNPLKMIVESSGGPEFASEVRNPMLTLEAVTLMRGCLGEKEAELWHSLGDNWIRPRLDFPRDYAAPYTPTFRSGWEPPRLDSSGQPWEDPVEMQHRHEERRAQQSAVTIAANGHRHPDKKMVICTHNFTARNNNELSVLQEDVLEVLDDSKKWWKVQNRYGQVGYVPYNILSPIMNGEESGVQNHKRTAQVNGTSPVISKKIPPQPPPKTKTIYSNGRNWASTEALNMDLSDRERFNTVNEELALRLANGSAARKNLHIQRAPDTNVPLGYDSNTAEVQTWLEAKGFNPFTVKAFGVLSGAQLFSLQKEEFKAVSPEEGARVYSQVTVQRALLEDSGKISELEAVMKKQKRKLEGMSE
ncbi:epidermal growth factor receptor kinase substrate 8-like protein 1 [Anolis carolinensis]|uniref:epidermal growth factor receptor kinase substrate 8-like protein 1 n=1 Tax=Anolis carolinensis TaxID=28377 RepID=UPI00046272A9|nr:PREDICTED: epidermal growth factor receptor kinase substrate 8-like protein 1 [Anolis carolinensis]|eukprot:XP_016851989.1 PREDICTED: epidermal growth factor receptor kinase substrate 8-like protein 1 [Anolis carolinensis]